MNWVQFGANSKPTWVNNGSVILAFVIVLLRGFVVSLNCEQSKHILFDIYWMEIMAKINYQVWHPMPHTHNCYWWSANREQWNVHIEMKKPIETNRICANQAQHHNSINLINMHKKVKFIIWNLEFRVLFSREA